MKISNASAQHLRLRRTRIAATAAAVAFVTPSGRSARPLVAATTRPKPTLIARIASTLNNPATTGSGEAKAISDESHDALGGSWKCNDDAECERVPECDDNGCRTSLDVRIHGEWYDLTGTFSVLHCVASSC